MVVAATGPGLDFFYLQEKSRIYPLQSNTGRNPAPTSTDYDAAECERERSISRDAPFDYNR